MLIFKRKLIGLSVGLVLGAGNANAADWTIVQTATLTAIPVMTQGATADVNGGFQAVNEIFLDNTADSIAATTTQTVTASAITTISLTQGPLITSATQALNHITAMDISTTTQLVTPPDALTLIQSATGGGGDNVQAVNNAEAAGEITGLTQTFAVDTTLSMTQLLANTGTGNHQAVNRAEGTVTGSGGILQTVTGGTGASTMSQLTGALGNVQAGNLIDILDGSITTGLVTDAQTYTHSTALTMIQEGAGTANGVQALNAVIYSAGATASQVKQSAIISGVATMTQDNTADAHQAMNYIGLEPSST